MSSLYELLGCFRANFGEVLGQLLGECLGSLTFGQLWEKLELVDCCRGDLVQF